MTDPAELKVLPEDSLHSLPLFPLSDLAQKQKKARDWLSAVDSPFTKKEIATELVTLVTAYQSELRSYWACPNHETMNSIMTLERKLTSLFDESHLSGSS